MTLRGYKASTAKYEATRQGVEDRMAYLQGTGVTVSDETIKGKKVKVPALSNYYGNETKDIGAAVADLARFADHVHACLAKTEVSAAVGTNIALVEKFAAAQEALPLLTTFQLSRCRLKRSSVRWVTLPSWVILRSCTTMSIFKLVATPRVDCEQPDRRHHLRMDAGRR